MKKRKKSIASLPLPQPLVAFFQAESSGGLVMIMAAVLAFIFANGETADWYSGFIAFEIGAWSLTHWVNDVLMVFFFLLVGMELKREMTGGVLADKTQITLPLAAAIGGMALPAAIYLLINYETPAHLNGWAIPSATDIAFALCVLTLVGKSLPNALKVFLLAIAIFDDLGAILIIALFYNHELALLPLVFSAATIGAMLLINRLKIKSAAPYLALGVLLWFGLHEGGIHTTLAGVITGIAIPARSLHTAIHRLHPWVAFSILPLFAFVSSGVNISGLSANALLAPLPVSIALGLFLGKQIGICGITWLFVRCKWAVLPEETGWRHMYGVSVIAGIGFTMSLFIGGLAFSDPLLQEQVKIGVMAGSLLSSFLGWLVLKGAKPRTT